jgi:hypothetical protein
MSDRKSHSLAQVGGAPCACVQHEREVTSQGQRLAAGADGPHRLRDVGCDGAAEGDLAAQGEAADRTMVAAGQPTRPARKKAAGAAASKGTRLIKPTG